MSISTVNTVCIYYSISVENKDNKTSPPFRLKVQMCTGCSDHGTCTDVIRSDPKETEDFKYWECKCEPQYEGKILLCYF